MVGWLRIRSKEITITKGGGGFRVNRFASRYVFPNVDGLESPISEEKERYGDLAYREERTYLGYGARTRFLSFYQGPLFWNLIHRTKN